MITRVRSIRRELAHPFRIWDLAIIYYALLVAGLRLWQVDRMGAYQYIAAITVGFVAGQLGLWRWRQIVNADSVAEVEWGPSDNWARRLGILHDSDSFLTTFPYPGYGLNLILGLLSVLAMARGVVPHSLPWITLMVLIPFLLAGIVLWRSWWVWRWQERYDQTWQKEIETQPWFRELQDEIAKAIEEGLAER